MFRVFLLLLLTFPVHAKDLVCTAFGYNIPIYKTNTVTLGERYGTAEGVAWIDRAGKPIIVYDEKLDSMPYVKNHVLAHECAHHRMGHIIDILRGYRSSVNLDENAADCFASKMITTQLGYGDKEFKAITQYIKQNMHDGEDRAHRIEECRL